MLVNRKYHRHKVSVHQYCKPIISVGVEVVYHWLEGWQSQYTIRYHYNGIFHTPLHWLMQNINHSLDSLMGMLRSVRGEDFRENSLCYNGTALYLHNDKFHGQISLENSFVQNVCYRCCVLHSVIVLKINTIYHAWDLWKLAHACKQLNLLYLPDPWYLPCTALFSAFHGSRGVLKSTDQDSI